MIHMTNKKSSKPRRAAAVAAGAWLPKGKPNISNWKGIEKNIFDYILLNVSFSFSTAAFHLVVTCHDRPDRAIVTIRGQHW